MRLAVGADATRCNLPAEAHNPLGASKHIPFYVRDDEVAQDIEKIS